MSSSVHVDNIEKGIIFFGEGPTRGLDDTTITAKAKTSFVLSLHQNRTESYLFVNATKIHQFKAEDSEIEPYKLCLLANVSKNFTIHNIKKAGLKGVVKVFFG